MNDWKTLTVLIVLMIIILFYYFNPNIEIVQIENHRYKILLWYNSYDRETYTIKRKYIKLFNFKTKKT